MRMQASRSAAARTTSATASMSFMFPGLMRTPSAPALSDSTASPGSSGRRRPGELPDVALDPADGTGVLAPRSRDSHDVAPVRRQIPDLAHGCRHVRGVGLRHPLDGDGVVAPDEDATEMDDTCPSSHGEPKVRNVRGFARLPAATEDAPCRLLRRYFSALPRTAFTRASPASINSRVFPSRSASREVRCSTSAR